MKKNLFKLILLFTILGFSSVKSFALEYIISFASDDLLIEIDSVKVTNLSKSTTATVPKGYSLKLSDVGTGLNNLNSYQNNIFVYSNQSTSQITAKIIAPYTGKALIAIYGIDGKKQTEINSNLQVGENSYQISVPVGSYILKVYGNEYSLQTKFVNLKEHVNYTKIEAIATAISQDTKPSQKAKTALYTSMYFENGDQLQYQVFSGISSVISYDTPAISNNYLIHVYTCIDGSGNGYPTVSINGKKWMAENLRTTRYSDIKRTNIMTNPDSIFGDIQWRETFIPAYCYYNNDPTTAKKYGILYNQLAIYSIELDSTKNICPKGYRLPTMQEWNQLSAYLNGSAKSIASKTGWGFSLTLGHVGNNVNSNNSTGFSAYPSGWRKGDYGNFQPEGTVAYFWTSDYPNGTSAAIYYNKMGIYSESHLPQAGLPCRCVKD